jgi:hypothetical protein
MKKLITALAVCTVTVAATATSSHADLRPTAEVSRACADYFHVASGPEPLSSCQWDMRRIHAGGDRGRSPRARVCVWA